MSDYVVNWKQVIDSVRYNPHAIQRVALNALDHALKGTLEISDPTNPLIFLTEASAVNAAACMEHAEAINRQQYPMMALTEDELYLHMSDVDYVGRFATPSRALFHLMFNKEELYARAVSTGVGNIKKITIPRNTSINFGDAAFTMQYPIDIRIMSHGGLQIVYDNSKPSPLQPLSSNIVDWRTVRYQDAECIMLNIPFEQFKITPHLMKLTLATAAAQNFTFQDQFYYARVYRSIPNGQWVEMRTTHTDQVFDPAVPTAVLRVFKNTLNVSIPQIYLNTGMIDSEIRIDVYTTRGEWQQNLEGYSHENFQLEWRDNDSTAAQAAFSAPLSVFNEYWTFSGDTTAGGTNGITVAALRNRIISNATGATDVPITNAQLTTRLQDLGYSVVLNVDNVTNREFLATRLLPRPESQSVVAGAGCTVKTVAATMDTFVTHRTVVDNGSRITILPDTLYRDVNGVVSIVSDNEIDQLLALPADIRARKVNEQRFMYSPFHYVLDMSDNRFDHRGYYLDSPKFEASEFVSENDTTGISVGTERVEIFRIAEGYRVLIRCRSTDAWKQLSDDKVHCQLAFRPVGEKDLAYLNGTLIGLSPQRERIFEFILGTNYDLDNKDNIVLTTFQMYADEARKHSATLLGDYSVFYAVSSTATPGYVRSEMDTVLGKRNLPISAIAVTQEGVRLKLGEALNGLWTASRSVASSQDYLTYLSDVPAVYDRTVYKRDPDTGAIEITQDGAGNLIYTILHNVGDPILDQNDDPTFAHRAGDVVFDVDGNPVVVSSRKLLRMIDVFFVDGGYWFATEETAVRYSQEIPKTVVGWLRNDILPTTKFLLEQTNLYFYPKSTLGHASVIVGENSEISIPVEQSFSVTFYLSAVQYRDIALRKALSQMAVRTINEALQSNVVTSNDLTKRLTDGAGGDAIAVNVSGLGGSLGLDAITMLDDSARLSIRKKARALEDSTIAVEDDVAITFIAHTS